MHSIEINPHKYYAPKYLVEIGIASKSTLAVWRMKGKGIPYTKLGSGLVKYLGSDVLSYVEARKVTPEMEADMQDIEKPPPKGEGYRPKPVLQQNSSKPIPPQTQFNNTASRNSVFGAGNPLLIGI